MNIGKRIRALRKKNRWTQQEFAKKAGIHPRMVGKYENNEMIPNADTLVKMAKALCTSVDYLVFDEQDNQKIIIEDIQLLELCQKVDKMRSDKRDVIKSVIDAFVHREENS